MLEWKGLGIVEWPVTALDSGENGTRFAAAHGDEQCSVTLQIHRESARPRGGEIDADFAHDGDDLVMNLSSRFGSRGDRVGAMRIGHQVEERRRDLGPTSVVHAREDDFDAHVPFVGDASGGAVGVASNKRRWNQIATLTRAIKAGTSTSGPMTAANAAPL